MISPDRPLTARELEALALYIEGFTHKEAGPAMHVLPNTVRVLNEELRRKWPDGTRGWEIVQWGIAHGVVRVDLMRIMKQLIEKGPLPLP